MTLALQSSPIKWDRKHPTFLSQLVIFFFPSCYTVALKVTLCVIYLFVIVFLHIGLLRGTLCSGKGQLCKQQVQGHGLPIVCNRPSYTVNQESLFYLLLSWVLEYTGNESKPTGSQRIACTSDCESHHQAKYSIRPFGKASCYSEVGLHLCSAQHAHLERED